MNKIDFQSALALFTRTMLAPGPRGRTVGNDIANGMLALADEETVTEVSQLVSDALACGQRVWITSDLHLNHQNIISFCDRPFGDVKGMNAALRRTLLKVGEDDLMIIAGDVKMGEDVNPAELQGLPGRKILVVGNHDFTYAGKPRFDRFREPDGRPVFDHVVPFLFWTEGFGRTATPAMVTHFPLNVPPSCDPEAAERMKNYHGHLHDVFEEPKREVKYVNVCWDVNHGLHCL